MAPNVASYFQGPHLHGAGKFHGVEAQQIAVLSQYKTQCSHIEKDLKQAGIENSIVGTVVMTQGTHVSD